MKFAGDFAYDIELSRKGLMLKSSMGVKNRILSSGDTVLTGEYTRLSSLRKQIMEIPFNGTADELMAKEALQQQANDLEKAVTLKSLDFRNAREESAVTWKAVQKALKPEEAAIEFSGFHFYNNKNQTDKKFDLVQVGSTRNLAAPAERPVIATAVIYGGINYDTLQPDSTNRTRLLTKSNVETSGAITFEGTFRGGFSYLPGTLKEAQTIAGSLSGRGIKTVVKSGTGAPEESFASLSGSNAPSLIHIATHGFYLPDTISDKNRKSAMYSSAGEMQFRYSEDPLQRSGILMTGANLSWKGLPRPEGTEDGILTAREVSNMNLANTKLVVLSACQTGLGDVKGSEGVEGLERGFKMAGVRYIVMSLWQVPDKETTRFMTMFYDSWLGGRDFREAFRLTRLAMRKKFPEEPFKWAGFVMVE